MINNPPNISTPVFDTCTPGEKELTANIPAVILKANTARKYVVLMNNSPVEVTLLFADIEKVNKGIDKGIVIKPSGSYEINFNNLYVGALCAVSKFACKLAFMECVE